MLNVRRSSSFWSHSMIASGFVGLYGSTFSLRWALQHQMTSKKWLSSLIQARLLKSSIYLRRVSCTQESRHWWSKLTFKRDNTLTTCSHSSLRQVLTLRAHAWPATYRKLVLQAKMLSSRKLYNWMSLLSWALCSFRSSSLMLCVKELPPSKSMSKI